MSSGRDAEIEHVEAGEYPAAVDSMAKLSEAAEEEIEPETDGEGGDTDVDEELED